MKTKSENRSKVQQLAANAASLAPAPSRPPSKAGEILSVNGLGVRRDGTVILHDLDWTVRKGEHWVILGANGSGKTSLLAALTGYLMPTRGDIHVLGRK